MADAVSTLQVIVEGKDETTKVLKGIESNIIRFVGAVTASLAAISVVAFPIKAAATFQRELLNVGKTTEFTDSQLTVLGDGLKKLSYNLNVSADDLAKIAAAGGQMGLGTEGVSGILIFTEAASRLSSVLDITAQESGDALGRLTNIFKINISEAEKISSLLNEISNNSTAKGADLIDMVQRIGTAGGTLGIKQAAALAATGRDLGLTVETVGTSFNKIFLSLQAKAAAIAPILGMPVEKFAATVEKDGVGALKLYLNALSKMGNVQRSTFAQQISGGGRIFALVTSLIKDADSGYVLLNKHLAEANVGFDVGKSAIKEQERVMTGLIAQGQVLINVFTGIAETVGRKALPYLTQLAKQMQEWAKDPAIIEFFSSLAGYFGAISSAVIGLVKTLSGLSIVVGPLLTVFQIFLGTKIIGGILGITFALIAQARAVGATTAAWYGLATANQRTVTNLAGAAQKIVAANKKAADSGKPVKNISLAGQTANYMNTALTPKFDAQNAADKLVTERTQQRLTVLGKIRTEMANITANYQAQATAAGLAVRAAGGTQKAANAAAKASRDASNLRLMNLSIANSNLGRAFDDSIQKRQAAANAVASTSSAVPVFAALGGSIGKVAANLGTLFMRFIGFAGQVAMVIGLVTFFLDMFGVLDPVIAKLKSFFGIYDEARVAQQRQAAAQAEAMDKEILAAGELAKIYETQQKAKEELAKAGKAPARVDAPDNLAKEITQLNIVNGQYETLNFKAASIVGSTGLLESQWMAVNKQLAEAKANLERLKVGKVISDASAGANPLRQKSAENRSAAADKEIATTKERIIALSDSLDLLSKARERYSKEASDNAVAIAKVAQEAMDQAARIAPLFDAGGLAALQAFELVLAEQKKLDAAKKELENADKARAAGGGKEQDNYLLVEQKVNSLETSLGVLQEAYDNVRLSSVGATVFMANAFPDAAKVTVEKVQSLIRILGGLSTGTNKALSDKKKSISEQLREIDLEQTKLDGKLAKDTQPRDPSKGLIGQFVGGNSQASIAAAEAAYGPANKALDARRQKLIAIQKQLELEDAQAKKLQSTYAKVIPQDAGRGKAGLFASTAALKQLTNLQIAAQDQVSKSAAFNAENIKKLYEEAKSTLASTVNDAKSEIAKLGQYFASRNLTLKLANFDISQGQNNDAYKKAQDDMLASEKATLEARGLSSTEIAKHIDLLKESFTWSDKMRTANQDEARQRIIISDILQQINTEQAALADASAKSATYAGIAMQNQLQGNQAGEATYAAKAKVAAEDAKIATQALMDKVAEFKAEAAKPVSSPFGAKFIVSDSQIQDVVKSSNDARVQAAKDAEVAMKQASEARAKTATDEAAFLEKLQKDAVKYQGILNDIYKSSPALASIEEKLGARILSATQGMDSVVSGLKSIANSDFRGLDQFATVADQASKIAAMEQSIGHIGQIYADTIVPVGASAKTISDILVGSLPAADALFTKLRASLSGASADVSVKYPNAAADLQKALEDGKIRVPISFTSAQSGDNIRKNAEGGAIRGPGTGTSDSILSWLSNGEYVNDAQTTSYFGENFFQTLKSIARGGRAVLSNFATKVSGGIRLPALAGGGYVGPSLVGGGGGISSLLPSSNDAILGRYAVDLNIGGDKVSMLGERAEVDRLVKALHKINRG